MGKINFQKALNQIDQGMKEIIYQVHTANINLANLKHGIEVLKEAWEKDELDDSPEEDESSEF